MAVFWLIGYYDGAKNHINELREKASLQDFCICFFIHVYLLERRGCQKSKELLDRYPIFYPHLHASLCLAPLLLGRTSFSKQLLFSTSYFTAIPHILFCEGVSKKHFLLWTISLSLASYLITVKLKVKSYTFSPEIFFAGHIVHCLRGYTLRVFQKVGYYCKRVRFLPIGLHFERNAGQ